MSDNDNLELKKRSRRRLVGAAALALIAAIVLPMVMDGEPVPPVSDIQVTIPERTVDARPIAPREAIAEPVADAPAELATPVVVEPPRAEPAQPAPVPAPPKPENSTPPAPKPAAKPEPVAPKPAPIPDPTPKPSAEVVPEESAEARRARAILEGRAAPQESSVQFLVQIGAFSDETKARTRQMDLAAKGFASFVESAGGVSRVRMGPFVSRAEAEAMIVRLRGASFDGVVTTR